MTYIYKNIMIEYNDEDFRKNRLIKFIDELKEDFQRDPAELIRKLEDDKGTLNIYWIHSQSEYKVSIFLKNVINSLWMDYHEFHTKHIILNPCSCCNSPVQKEDLIITNYINNLI